VSARQIKACAAKLPEPERAQFLALHEAASAILREAFAEAKPLRAQAWSLYRQFKQPADEKKS